MSAITNRNGTFRSSDSLKLIEEAVRTRDSPHIPLYRADLIKNSLEEIKHLSNQTAAAASAIAAGTMPSSKANSSMVGHAIRRLYIERAKRSVLAYQRNRLNRYIDLIWQSGANSASLLPVKSQKAASIQETTFIQEYQDLVTTWKGLWLDVDVGASIMPPKDVFIEIRVLQDCGEIMTDDKGPLVLKAGSHLCVKRTDVEDLILLGLVEHHIA